MKGYRLHAKTYRPWREVEQVFLLGHPFHRKSKAKVDNNDTIHYISLKCVLILQAYDWKRAPKDLAYIPNLLPNQKFLIISPKVPLHYCIRHLNSWRNCIFENADFRLKITTFRRNWSGRCIQNIKNCSFNNCHSQTWALWMRVVDDPEDEDAPIQTAGLAGPRICHREEPPDPSDGLIRADHPFISKEQF